MVLVDDWGDGRRAEPNWMTEGRPQGQHEGAGEQAGLPPVAQRKCMKVRIRTPKGQ